MNRVALTLSIFCLVLATLSRADSASETEAEGEADSEAYSPYHDYVLQPLPYKKAAVHVDHYVKPYPRRPRPYGGRRRKKGRYNDQVHVSGPPSCIRDKPEAKFCVDDYEYPKYEIEEALLIHYDYVTALYKDVLLNTDNSVERLKNEEQEKHYLCPSEIDYVQPLRGLNSMGKWKVIVNKVRAGYGVTLTQNARFEECTTSGQKCPLVPQDYQTRCIQKATYQRFLVYDPYDEYSPFSIDSFKVPTACGCMSPEYYTPEELEEAGPSAALSLPVFRNRPQGLSFVQGEAGPQGQAQRLAQTLDAPFDGARLSPLGAARDDKKRKRTQYYKKRRYYKKHFKQH